MFNFIVLQKKNIKEHNPNWSEIPDHLYQILIIGALAPEKQMHYEI